MSILCVEELSGFQEVFVSDIAASWSKSFARMDTLSGCKIYICSILILLMCWL